MQVVQKFCRTHPWWVGLAGTLSLALLYRLLFGRTKRTSYKGKCVVLTGASSGIGEQLAYQFAAQGARLVLAARRVDMLGAVLQKCKELGGEAIAVPTDVAKPTDCKNLVDAAVKAYGTIDLLLLNAGVGCLLQVNDLVASNDFSPYRQTMEVNYWGSVYPTVYALPYLRKSHGTVLSISSLASKFATPGRAGYSASKCAINGFLSCLRVEEKDIHVCTVCPGFVVSEIHEHAFKAKAMEREIGTFMSAEQAAKIIIDAGATRKRELIMTLSANFGVYASLFFPTFVDNLAVRKAQNSFKKNE